MVSCICSFWTGLDGHGGIRSTVATESATRPPVPPAQSADLDSGNVPQASFRSELAMPRLSRYNEADAATFYMRSGGCQVFRDMSPHCRRSTRSVAGASLYRGALHCVSLAAMAEGRLVVRAGEDMRGTNALSYLCAARDLDKGLFLDLSSVRLVDAWTGAVVRVLLEACFERGLSVELVEPREEKCRRLLVALVGELPDGLETVQERWKPGRSDSSVLLAAQRFASIGQCVGAACALPRLRVREREDTWLAGLSLIHLVDNGLSHGRDSRVDTVACVAQNAADELQVVVADLGTGIRGGPPGRNSDLETTFGEATARLSGLGSLAPMARRLDVSLLLFLASGTSRLRVSGCDHWQTAEGAEDLPGLVASVTIRRPT